MPVILYLKDIEECKKFEKRKELAGKTFVFDAMKEEHSDNIGFLDLIKKADNGPQVILTTKAASFGINFYRKAYPIMTEHPTTWAEYQQIVGRSNRIDYTGEKKAALLTSDKYVTQVSME